MTENEAIEALRLSGGLEISGRPRRCAEFFEGLDIAIKAFEEIQQYQAIGTVDECQAAMEKQKPQPPHIWGDGYDKEENIIYDMYDCPGCGQSYEIDDKYKHCPECGQAINWRDFESL